MSKSKSGGVDKRVEEAVYALLKDAQTFKDKTAAIDRALKLEQIKHKIQDDDFGADFDLRDET